MRIIVSLLVLLCSANTFAQSYHPHPVDLSHVSDRDLLREMDRRNYSCKDTSNYETEKRIVSVTCDPYAYMIVTLLDSTGTTITSSKLFMSSTDFCGTEKNRIQAATHGQIYQDRVVAFCDPYAYMVKYRLGLNNVAQVEKTFMSSVDRCSDEADSFNNLFPSQFIR